MKETVAASQSSADKSFGSRRSLSGLLMRGPLGLPVPKFKVEFSDAVDLINGLTLRHAARARANVVARSASLKVIAELLTTRFEIVGITNGLSFAPLLLTVCLENS
jgi:hypothetical protein